MIEQKVLTRRIRVERSIATDDGGVVAAFRILPESETPRRVRIADRIPEEITVERLLFHPEFAPLEWGLDDHRVTFEVVVSPPEPVTTVYGLLTPEDADGVEFKGPTVESNRTVEQGDVEELVSRQSAAGSSDAGADADADADDPRVRRLLSRMEDAAGEPAAGPPAGPDRDAGPDEAPVPPEDGDPSSPPEVTPVGAGGPEGTSGSSPGDEPAAEQSQIDDPSDEDRVRDSPGGDTVATVIDAIGASELDADTVRRLRRALADEIASTTDARPAPPDGGPEAPAPDDGPGPGAFEDDGPAGRLPADLERLIEGLRDRIEALEADIRRIDEELFWTRERIATLEERAAGIDRLEERLARLEADLGDTRESIDADLAALREDVEAGKEWRQSVVELFGEEAAATDDGS